MDRRTFQGLSMPCAFLNEDALERNIQSIIQLHKGKRVRIASKSLRSVSVMKKILQSHSCFQGIMCYSPAEVLFLIEQGFDDLLLGYPAWDEEALQKISILTKQGYKITCMVDCEEHILYLEHIALQVEGKFRICFDIDMSSRFLGFHFGVKRSPLRTAEQVLQVADRVLQSSCFKIDGVMGYEAQIAGVGDNVPKQSLHNKVVSYLKRRSVREVAKRRELIVQALGQKGISLRFVNGGGTGSIKTTVQDESVTEITVGSAFYSPLLFDYYKDIAFEPAVGFVLPIVRQPEPRVYTCLGGGYIASGMTGKEKQPQPYMPSGAKLLPLEGAGEVQTPVYYEGTEQLRIGEGIVFRHSKAGELCERFSSLHRISDGEVVGEYRTYRGDGQCFL
ncbi:amino acid deaminase/aldolase [Bacillus sp. NPDC077411]|uniref:Amino acid deaminase/aldolase n=1 Tax=Bacillus bruguierae TaxID=3127667 RepID=A0ABU8FL05_9BACI